MHGLLGLRLTLALVPTLAHMWPPHAAALCGEASPEMLPQFPEQPTPCLPPRNRLPLNLAGGPIWGDGFLPGPRRRPNSPAAGAPPPGALWSRGRRIFGSVRAAEAGQGGATAFRDPDPRRSSAALALLRAMGGGHRAPSGLPGRLGRSRVTRARSGKPRGLGPTTGRGRCRHPARIPRGGQCRRGGSETSGRPSHRGEVR